MTKRLDALRERIVADPQRRERLRAYSRAIETALALGRLREARAVTQAELAARMAVSQANISRIEHEDDVYLSTLRAYVENLGGRLEINAVFPDVTIAIGTDGRPHAVTDSSADAASAALGRAGD
jgi:DNA-binding Xre family transcriptional regulator